MNIHASLRLLANKIVRRFLFTAMLLLVFVLMFSSFDFSYIRIAPQQQNIEICDNGIDDDGDGLIDLNDEDCVCVVIEPKSLIPNPSFEEKSCCPNNRAELHCSVGWIQASTPTTDYIHTCGWMGPDDYLPPLPFPDGNGIMGFRDGRVGRENGDPNPNWKEYAGACLNSPLEKNVRYRFEFDLGFIDYEKSPPINITFFGTTDCKHLPFGGQDERFGCPTNGPNWVRLGSEYFSGTSNGWVKGAIEITPDENIMAIAIGPECREITSTVNLYYYFDNLILSDAKSFEFRISEIGHPCADDFKLQVPIEEDLQYQWYKNGVAIVNETEAVLSRPYGEGKYQARTLGASTCRVTKPYVYTIPRYSFDTKVTLCEDEEIQFGPRVLNVSGTYVETFKNPNNCDSIVTLELTMLPKLETSTQVKIFEGETYKLENYSFRRQGVHDARIGSALGCDSLIHLDLEYYNVYFPNVFSPHSTIDNDMFTIHGNTDLVEIKRLNIFDRWGTSVYLGTNLLGAEVNGWGGRYNGSMVEPGVYTYVTTLLMEDGIERQFSGSVLLVL